MHADVGTLVHFTRCAVMQTGKCPQCRKETPWQDNAYRPFCSERCRTLDLGAWASDTYHIPGEQADLTPSEDTEPNKL